MRNQDEDNLFRLIGLARNIDVKVEGLELLSKGVRRELERFNLLQF